MIVNIEYINMLIGNIWWNDWAKFNVIVIINMFENEYDIGSERESWSSLVSAKK